MPLLFPIRWQCAPQESAGAEENSTELSNWIVSSNYIHVHFYPGGDVLHSCIVRERDHDGEEQENKDHHQRHFARIAFLILSHRRYNVIMRLLIKPPLWSQVTTFTLFLVLHRYIGVGIARRTAKSRLKSEK